MQAADKTKQLIKELTELRGQIGELEKSEAKCKQAEERLKQQAEFMNLVLESLPHPFYVINASDYTIRIANSATLDGQLSKGVTCHALTHKSDKPCASEGHPCPLQMVRDTKQPVTVEHVHYDKEGIPMNVEVHAYPIFDSEGNVSEIIESCIDITERKRAEERLVTYYEKLRSLTSALSLAEERERRRIASKVHDHIAQNLAFVKMNLGTLRASIPSGRVSDTMDKIIQLLGETIQDTRSLVSELGSPVLYELGFVPAVQWLTQQSQKRHGILVSFEDDGRPKPLSDDVRVLLFQGVRELLANVVKHAKARSVKVSITRNDDQVRIDVEDDGVGFNTTELGSSIEDDNRFGLFSIRERLDSLGGYLQLESKPGHGTRVSLIGPLKKDIANKGMAA
jgi:signal transduction histidine kinase